MLLMKITFKVFHPFAKSFSLIIFSILVKTIRAKRIYFKNFFFHFLLHIQLHPRCHFDGAEFVFVKVVGVYFVYGKGSI